MLEVIGAGFGRTGTLSLKTALDRLGFGPCYHAIELLRHPEHLPLWEAAMDGAADWEHVFAGYRATVDWPSVTFWRELVDAYPDAKVVLTVRDPKKWHTSIHNTLLPALSEADEAPPLLTDAGISGEDMGRFVLLIRRMMSEGDFWDRVQEEQSAVAEFERHTEEVRGYVPTGRLLVFDVAQGWEPLCEFLGVDTPQGEPFPRLNESESFGELIPRFVARNDSVAPPA